MSLCRAGHFRRSGEVFYLCSTYTQAGRNGTHVLYRCCGMEQPHRARSPLRPPKPANPAAGTIDAALVSPEQGDPAP
ncbi:unnamed protein product [Acidocella sp. C78]|nr:unnamed protein product [Acidocella sp. C78]